MIYTVLPISSFHGWGVCGKYITRELSKLDDVTLISPHFTFEALHDEFDYRLLKSKLVNEEEYVHITNSTAFRVNHPVLQCITDNSLLPVLPQSAGQRECRV